MVGTPETADGKAETAEELGLIPGPDTDAFAAAEVTRQRSGHDHPTCWRIWSTTTCSSSRSRPATGCMTCPGRSDGAEVGDVGIDRRAVLPPMTPSRRVVIRS